MKTSDEQSALSGDVCVDDVPSDHQLLSVKKLEEEGQQAFNTVLMYQSSAHISRSTPHLIYIVNNSALHIIMLLAACNHECDIDSHDNHRCDIVCRVNECKNTRCDAPSHVELSTTMDKMTFY